MKKIEAYFRPDKLHEVIRELRKEGVSGFSVLPVQGRGQQKDTKGVYRGKAFEINLHPKVKMEMVVSDHYAQLAIAAIIKGAQTGQMGDGKIFVTPVLEAYNIRTGVIDETIDELNR